MIVPVILALVFLAGCQNDGRELQNALLTGLACDRDDAHAGRAIKREPRIGEGFPFFQAICH